MVSLPINNLHLFLLLFYGILIYLIKTQILLTSKLENILGE